MQDPCLNFQEWTIGRLAAPEALPDALAAHAVSCGACAEFAADHEAIVRELQLYRERVLEAHTPSARQRRALERTLVELVREDVKERARRRAPARRASLAVRLVVSWRELTKSSQAFRWASQGTMALGVGLFLALFVAIVAGRGAAGGAPESMPAQRFDTGGAEHPTTLPAHRGEPPVLDGVLRERLPRKG